MPIKISIPESGIEGAIPPAISPSPISLMRALHFLTSSISFLCLSLSRIITVISSGFLSSLLATACMFSFTDASRSIAPAASLPTAILSYISQAHETNAL